MSSGLLGSPICPVVECKVMLPAVAVRVLVVTSRISPVAVRLIDVALTEAAAGSVIEPAFTVSAPVSVELPSIRLLASVIDVVPPASVTVP